MSSSDRLPDQLTDKLTIETPEQTPLEFPLAGIGSRFLALAFDTLIQFAAISLLGIVSLLLAPSIGKSWQAEGMWAMAIVGFLVFSLYFGYFGVFEAVWNGQTPGKRFTRLRVIQSSGRPVTVYQAVARNLLRIVDQLPGFYAVGILAALLNRQNKRLGDYVAGTVVVHEKALTEVQPEWGLPGKSGAARFNAGRLSTEDLQLVETFLQRRSHLSAEVRAQMAQQIAERLAQKLAVTPTERPGAEAFLEALAEERRASAGYH